MVKAQYKQEVASMFNRAAHLYGQVGIKQFTHFGNLLVNSLPIQEGAAILDIASGRGAILFPAAEKVGRTGRVIGIDLAPEMVRHTRKEIEQRHLSQVQVCLMDGDQVGFHANSFDFILCGFALHFLDYTNTLSRFLDLLKPGGCFAAIQPTMPQNREDSARWGWLFDLTREVFPEGFTPPSAWIAPNKLGAVELAQDALKQTGYINVRTEQHEAAFYFKDENDWWDWEWSQGSRFWLEGMSPEGLEHFKQEAFRHLKEMKESQGIGMKTGALFVIGYK